MEWRNHISTDSANLLMYEPPHGISPAAMRYRMRGGFANKTFVAALIDMAVNQFLSIKEKVGVFALQRKAGNGNALAPEESAAAGVGVGAKTSSSTGMQNAARYFPGASSCIKV